MSVKSFFSAKYICTRAEVVWKLMAAGEGSSLRVKALEVMPQGTEDDLKHFIYLSLSAAP